MSSKRKWLPAENGGKWAYMGNKITSRPHSLGLLSFTPPPALKVHCSCFFLNHPQYIFSSRLKLLMLHLDTCVFLLRQIRLQIKKGQKVNLSLRYCAKWAMFLSLPVHNVLSVNKPRKYKLWELYTQEKEKAYYSTILTK